MKTMNHHHFYDTGKWQQKTTNAVHNIKVIRIRA